MKILRTIHAEDMEDIATGGAILGTDYGPPESPGIDQITLEHLLTHTAGGWSNDGRDPMFAFPQMSQTELIAWTIWRARSRS